MLDCIRPLNVGVWFLSSSHGDICLSPGVRWRRESLWAVEVLLGWPPEEKTLYFSFILCGMVLERWKMVIIVQVVF